MVPLAASTCPVKNAPNPPSHRRSRSPLAITAGSLVAAAILGLALWISVERQKSHLRLIEFQEIELQSLESALAAESLISQASLRQLRRHAAGGSFSAFATLKPAGGRTLPFEVVACWSDELAAGFLLLPAELSDTNSSDIRVHLRAGPAEDPFEATLMPSASSRIVGFTQPANQPPPEHITFELRMPSSPADAVTFTADWDR